jgi:hypothetical protein
VSSEEYKRIEDAARYGQKPRKNQNFIYLWKGGFVFGGLMALRRHFSLINS